MYLDFSRDSLVLNYRLHVFFVSIYLLPAVGCPQLVNSLVLL